MKTLDYKIQNSDLLDNEVRYLQEKDFSSLEKDFINEEEIIELLNKNKNPDKKKIRDIIQKSLSIERLEPEETASLLNVGDEDLWEEIFTAALRVKKQVYDNRIVTFAPLYLSNFCINNCLYCGFRRENNQVKRRRLNLEEVKKETEAICKIGHKRLIVVYGEHPLSNLNYMKETIQAIYNVKVKAKQGIAQIRRVNLSAPPLNIEGYKILKEIGIGTYQVFQETYHHKTYQECHPKGPKSNYRWRLFALHRAQEAGLDDVGIGVLFGLYDWKFEVIGLLYHTMDLEEKFGVGPHTISFPRLEPAENTPFIQRAKYRVSDSDFKKIVAVIRLTVPYTGMILTAREPAYIRRAVLRLGITQTDASSRIGIGAYSQQLDGQQPDKQQFLLGDIRSLDELIGEFSQYGIITSFCTAGYRCGRTGKCIMSLLKTGKERWLCKLNAVLTFREWLDDFATSETKRTGEGVIEKELAELKEKLPEVFPRFTEFYRRIENGERDLYF